MSNIESRQTIVEYSEASRAYGLKDDYAINDFMALKEDIRNLIDLLNNESSTFTPQFSTGSPEGVITANYNRTYYDTALSPASVSQWVNPIVGEKTGWVIVV